VNLEKVSRGWRVAGLVLALAALAAFGLSPATAATRNHHPPSLRQQVDQLRSQVTELRLQMAQLQSLVAAQSRRLGGSEPGTGMGLCTDPCTVDSDGDGFNDCEDPCPCDPSNQDSDGDATPDCIDPCPDDATDACIDPCRQDSDGDGVNDCDDPCPFDPNPPQDEDGNGVPDCVDICWLIAGPGASGTSPIPCPVILRPGPTSSR